jgi:uncharacterized membrane protein YjjP (DUF1212 family)
MGSVTETTDIQRSLDLALRVGEMLLSNGAGAADVTATMSSITQYLGLRNVLVDVTFTTLTLSYEAGVDEPAITMRRQVTHRESDYADLTDVDHLVAELINEEITREEAAGRILQLSSSGHPTPRWAITLSWAVTATGVALLLGGDWVVMLLAAVSGAALEVLQRRLARLRLPFFYSQVAGGFLATTLAVGVAATPVPMDPSLVVTASIVMLLAGLGFIGAFQDALTGFYVTANARILEVMIATVGIIVGVSGGLGLGKWLGVDGLVDPDLSAGLSYLPGVIIGSAITAAGFAFSAYSPARILAPIAVIGGLGGGISFALIESQVHPAAAAGSAAFVIGLVSYSVAGRSRVPPLVIVVSSIVPLLPGLSIYTSLTLLAAENFTGIVAMITAIAVAVMLTAGVILGEYVAQPLQREARRLERRLSGPRLVGPIRIRHARRSRRSRGS